MLEMPAFEMAVRRVLKVSLLAVRKEGMGPITGNMTESSSWMTPLVATTSAFVTRHPPAVTT